MPETGDFYPQVRALTVRMTRTRQVCAPRTRRLACESDQPSNSQSCGTVLQLGASDSAASTSGYSVGGVARER